MLDRIQLTILSEIHCDLNIYNILGRLNPDDDENVVLIDPAVSRCCPSRTATRVISLTRRLQLRHLETALLPDRLSRYPEAAL